MKIIINLCFIIHLKLKKMKEKLTKILNWVITIATALVVLIDKIAV